MNTNNFNWQVYCIIEQGKRELDKLLDDTKDAICSNQMSVSFTLADWAAKMYEAGFYELDKAFWRCNIK